MAASKGVDLPDSGLENVSPSCTESVPPAGHQRDGLLPGHPHSSHQSGQRDGAESSDQSAGEACCVFRGEGTTLLKRMVHGQ